MRHTDRVLSPSGHLSASYSLRKYDFQIRSSLSPMQWHFLTSSECPGRTQILWSFSPNCLRAPYIGHSPSSTKSFPSFLSLFLSDLGAASGCFLINLALKQWPWGCWSPYSAALRSSWGRHQTGAETATPLNLLSCRWPDSQFKPFC